MISTHFPFLFSLEGLALLRQDVLVRAPQEPRVTCATRSPDQPRRRQQADLQKRRDPHGEGGGLASAGRQVLQRGSIDAVA